jgi:hypothetical protein
MLRHNGPSPLIQDVINIPNIGFSFRNHSVWGKISLLSQGAYIPIDDLFIYSVIYLTTLSVTQTDPG